jgi:hypothetical protein
MECTQHSEQDDYFHAELPALEASSDSSKI